MILEARDVSSGYAGIEILHGITLGVQRDSITAIIGPNGSGKSTLLKTIFGFIRPYRGRVAFEGIDITNQKPHALIRMGMSYLPQRRSVFPQLTVEENLKMGAWILKSDRSKVDDATEKVYQRFPDLREKSTTIAGLLSGGEQRMLELGRSLMTNPKMIIIDEFSAGLSPKIVSKCYRMLKELQTDENLSILAVDQNVLQILSISDYTYVLKLGRKVMEDPSDSLLARHEDVMRDWLRA
jgi:branched-chain amino acid transport system ATP-binding protein